MLKWVFLLFVATATLVGCSNPDAAEREKLLGTWRCEVSGYQPTLALRPDGTFDAHLEPTGIVTALLVGHLEVSGKWRVEDGKLVTTVSQSSSSAIPTGLVIFHEILETAADRFVTKAVHAAHNEIDKDRVLSFFPTSIPWHRWNDKLQSRQGF